MLGSRSYMKTLAWLGEVVDTPQGSTVLRRFADHWDARGSWPYQGVPTLGFLEAVRDIPGRSPLTFSTVVRPDLPAEDRRERLEAIGRSFRAEYRCLKPHLGHCPDIAPASDGYSARTLRRLRHAQTVFSVQREELGAEHMEMADWQERVRTTRAVSAFSSPDAFHFEGLRRNFQGASDRMACITLRRRKTGALSGVFLLVSLRDPESWHAHSFLTDLGALQDFGTFLLFDGAIRCLGDRPVWFGGAPSSPNGAGVYTFKSRFANTTAACGMLSVDLNVEALAKVRATHGPYSWLPDYRSDG